MGLVVLESGPGFTMRARSTRGIDGAIWPDQNGFQPVGEAGLEELPAELRLNPAGAGSWRKGRDRVARGPWGLKQPLFNHWWGTVSIF